MRLLLATLAAALLTGAPAHAVIFTFLDDEFDDTRLVREARDRWPVKTVDRRIESFERSLYRFKERDFAALFDKPQAKPEKTYAMPVAQARGLMLSGIRYSDPAMNKNHTDFHVLPGVAGLEVYYHIDGETPAVVLVYLPVDAAFPRLTETNLPQRLAWDTAGLDRLAAHLDSRLKAVFPYEVDRAEVANIETGDFSADPAERLRSWTASGSALGYTLREEVSPEGRKDWKWYGADDRRPAREASRGLGDGPPTYFKWLHPNGGERRSEGFDATGVLVCRRWCQDDTRNIRYETGVSWCWYGLDGKVVRFEWDDNGDGLPDLYVTAEDGIRHTGDEEAMKKRKELRLTESWAVNPALIPEECRIPDQPGLRVPVRLKGGAALATATGPESPLPAAPGPDPAAGYRGPAAIAAAAVVVVAAGFFLFLRRGSVGRSRRH